MIKTKPKPRLEFCMAIVQPVIDTSMRGLCCKPYHNHPRGCPNYGVRDTCPPKAKMLPEVFDLRRDIWALYAEFDLKAHIRKMQKLQPLWTDHQLRCCLYWQGTVRKFLRKKADEWVERHAYRHPRIRDTQGFLYTTCPEAMGVNVTATMRNAGINLEWPPRITSRMIYLAGVKNGVTDLD